MPQHINIEPRNEYLYVEVSGNFNSAKAKEFIQHIYSACQQHSLKKIFVDSRKITGPISNIAQFELARLLAMEQTVPVRMAVWKTTETGSNDNFFENVAVNRGAMVKVTNDLKEAIEWLEIKSTDNESAFERLAAAS